MMRFGVLALVAALCVGEPALAQTGRISGTVRSADGGAPVVAADIEVVGANFRRVAPTRDDGRFSISVEPGTYSVKAKRIGFAADSTQNVVVAPGASVTVNFTLRAMAVQVTGVTVVGYGTQEVRDNTGSVASVTPREFNPGRVFSAEQLIQAKVPGVQVVDNFEPGGGISLRIRGGTSVNASNEPLYVVDGVPLNVGGGLSSGRNPMNFLNPADIREITVLKDASATAIYGSRGANGVLLITTRNGSLGEPAFSYSTSFSSSSIVRRPDLMSAAEFRTAVQTYAPGNVGLLGTANTDWMDQLLRRSGGVENNISLSGAREDMRYRLSLGTLDQDGILLGTKSKRVSIGATYSDLLLDDKLEVRANVKATRNDDYYTPGGVIGQAVNMDPTQAVQTNGVYFQWANSLGTNNPVADLALLRDQGQVYRSIANIESKYYLSDYIDGLSVTMRNGFDYSTSTRTIFSPSTAQADIESSRHGHWERNTPRQLNTVFELFGNFNRKLDTWESTIDLTAGYTFEEQKGDYFFVWRDSLVSDLNGLNAVPNAARGAPTLNVEDARLISFFGRANWSYKDKYLATVSIRRDGSTRFGPDNAWGVFPAFAAAWRMIDEDWFNDISYLSDLKLRFSWGVNGNQSFGNYLYIPVYTIGGEQAQYQFGNSFVPTLRPSSVDPNLKWEQTTSTNFGVDFGFLNDRITGTLDWYTKDTKDLIFSVTPAAGTQPGNSVVTNIGSMNNKGIEIGLNTVVLDGRNGAWRYEAGFSIANNQNTITAISSNATDKIQTGGIAGGVGSRIQILQPGSAINTFYVYQHRNGADGKPVTGNLPDTAMYVDRNNDNIINQDDLRPYKNPAPRWIIGHTSTASWKDWDFSATARIYLGNYTYNNVASQLGYYSGLSGAFPSNRHRSVLKYDFQNPQFYNDLYVENASFFKLDNISASYTLRNLRGVRSVRLTGTIQNVFTSTKYSGVDPLAGLNGIDNNLFPASRTMTLGATFHF